MKRFTIDNYQYDVSREQLNYEDWFVQENSGDGTPILRKLVTPGYFKSHVETRGGYIHQFSAEHGYYPFDNIVLANDMTLNLKWFKVVGSDNPMLTETGINPL